MYKRISGIIAISLMLLSMLSIAPMASIVSGQQATPTIWLSASSGSPGALWGTVVTADRIYITGLGFHPAANVILYWTAVGAAADVQYTGLAGAVADQESIAVGAPAVAVTDGTGWFKVRVRVPQVPGGNYVVKALTAGAAPWPVTLSGSASFTVNPVVRVFRIIAATLDAGPSNGYVGENVRGEVGGFKAGESAIVTWGTQPAIFWTSIAMAVGYAAIPATLIPNSVGGARTITAIGDAGSTAATTFTVLPRIPIPQVSFAAGAGAPTPITGAALTGAGFTGSTVAFVRAIIFDTTGIQTAITNDLAIAAPGITAAGVAGEGSFALTIDPRIPFGVVAPMGLCMLQVITNLGVNNMTDIDDGTQTVRQTLLSSTAAGGAALFFRRGNTPISSLNVNVGDWVTVYGVGFPGGTDVTVAAGTTTPIAGVANERVASTFSFVLDTAALPVGLLPAAPGATDRTLESKTLVGTAFPISTWPAALRHTYIGRTDRPWQNLDRIDFGMAVACGAGTTFVINIWDGLAWTVDATATLPVPGVTMFARLGAGCPVGVVDTIDGHAAYWLEIITTPLVAAGTCNYILRMDRLVLTGGFPNPSLATLVAPTATTFDAAATSGVGAFWASFTVVPQRMGNLYLAGAWGAGYASVSNTITMTVQPALYDNTLGVDGPGSVVTVGARLGTSDVGDALTIWGEGFYVDPVTGTAEAATITVNGVGTAVPTQVAPDATYGDFAGQVLAIQAETPNLAVDSINVTGTTTGNRAGAVFTFTPRLDALTPAGPGIVGATVRVQADGLQASTSYVVTWGAADSPNATIRATTDSTPGGSIDTNIVVPDSVGRYAPLAVGVGIHLIDIALASAPTVSVIYANTVQAFPATNQYAAATPAWSQWRVNSNQVSTPAAQVPGYSVSVTCRGLLYRQNYWIWFGPALAETLVAGPIQSNAVGTLTASFTVPNCTGVQGIDLSTSAIADTNTLTTVFTPVPGMSVSPTFGAVGATVTCKAVGLTNGQLYQVYWYLPSDVQTPGQIPTTAILMTQITGTLTGFGTATFPVPTTATPGQVYKVDLATGDPVEPAATAYPNTRLTMGIPSFTVTGGAGIGGDISTVFTDTTKVLGFELTGNIYDDSAAGYVAAKRSPPKISFLKTDATYINQVTGAPTWSGYDNLVAFGGRNANPTVAYYEDNGLAPIKFEANATHYRFLKAGVVQYAVLKTSISATNDYFVLEVATDGTHKVIILWGVEQYGTYASGVYLDGIWPNLSTLTQGWYIVNVSGTYPYPYPASYTVVASGT